jgi:hypothetical protein
LLDPEFTEKTSVYQYIPGKPYHICTLQHACWWFSPCNLVSSTNKIKLHDNTEILVKVALNTINLTDKHILEIKTIWEIIVSIHLVGNCHRWSIIGRCLHSDHRSWKFDWFPSLQITHAVWLIIKTRLATQKHLVWLCMGTTSYLCVWNVTYICCAN